MKRILAALLLALAPLTMLADWPLNLGYAGVFVPSGSGSTGGVNEAITAACALAASLGVEGGQVLLPPRNIATTAPITGFCNGLELLGYGSASRITFAAGTTGILVRQPTPTTLLRDVALRDFHVFAASSNAANVAIELDNDNFIVSRWKGENLRIIGIGDTGTGIRCTGCLTGALEDVHVADWSNGWELNHNTSGVSDPNNNKAINSVFSGNANNGINVIGDMKGVLTVIGSALEGNGAAAVRLAGTGGTGLFLSLGNHMEANVDGVRRESPSCCGFTTIATRFSANTGDDLSRQASGATDDISIADYFSTGGWSNALADCFPILFPGNLSASVADRDGCLIDTNGVAMIETVEDNSGTSVTGGYEDCRFRTLTNRGASAGQTITLPNNPSPGQVCTFVVVAAQTITLDPQGATTCSLGAACDQIIGATNAGGDRLQSAAVVGDSIEIVALSADEWAVRATRGTWTDIN